MVLCLKVNPWILDICMSISSIIGHSLALLQLWTVIFLLNFLIFVFLHWADVDWGFFSFQTGKRWWWSSSSLIAHFFVSFIHFKGIFFCVCFFLLVIRRQITCYSLNGTILFVFPLRINHSSISSMSLLISFFSSSSSSYNRVVLLCVYIGWQNWEKKKLSREGKRERKAKEHVSVSTLVRIRFEVLRLVGDEIGCITVRIDDFSFFLSLSLVPSMSKPEVRMILSFFSSLINYKWNAWD